MSIRSDLDETRREVTGFLWTRRSKFGKVGVSVLGVIAAYAVFAIALGAVIDAPETTTEAIVDTTTEASVDTTTTIEPAPTPEETVEETSTFPTEDEGCVQPR